MSTPPAQPKIYHITHVTNLPGIVTAGELFSDATMLARGGPEAAIGMSTIKTRRLKLPVDCHPNDFVGDYVPFHFCPRSIMLYVIHCGNSPDLSYRGGQGEIVTLEADLHRVIEWANTSGRRWAISFSNAGGRYARFSSNVDALPELKWDAIGATDFRSSEVKEGKQAEFLVHGSFPWTLVDLVGVESTALRTRAAKAFAAVPHNPSVVVRKDWYY